MKKDIYIPDLFKQSTELVFETIKNKYNFNVIDIEYLDGYSMSYIADNAIVHFHVKQCPDWKFGIWWTKENNFICGEFFAQYEPTIDKFKPSHSSYVSNIYISMDDEKLAQQSAYIFELGAALKFINKHPIRAWLHDYQCVDYNYKYISNINILIRYINYKFYAWKKKVIIPILDKKFVDFTYKLYYNYITPERLERGWTVHIVGGDPAWSPLYTIQTELPDNYDKDYQSTGCYSMFESDSAEQLAWNKKRQFYDKIADFFGLWWHRAIDDYVIYYNEKEYNDYINSTKKKKK